MFLLYSFNGIYVKVKRIVKEILIVFDSNKNGKMLIIVEVGW